MKRKLITIGLLLITLGAFGLPGTLAEITSITSAPVGDGSTYNLSVAWELSSISGPGNVITRAYSVSKGYTNAQVDPPGTDSDVVATATQGVTTAPVSDVASLNGVSCETPVYVYTFFNPGSTTTWVVRGSEVSHTTGSCPTGGGPTTTDPSAAADAEAARIAAWQASSQELDLTMVGAPAYSTNPGMNLQVGRVHKADLGAGVTEYGYFSEGIYVPLGWHKIDWLGNHYAVPEVDPILSVDQFIYALSLVGWYDGGGTVMPTGPGAAPAAPVEEGAPAGPAANALDLALRGGTPKKTDLGGGLLEFGVWKPDGGYTVLGWAQYDAWGNLMNMAVPDVNPTITRDQLVQFLASEPSFG